MKRAAVLVFLAAASSQAAEPLPVEIVTTTITASAERSVPVRVALPAGKGPYPLVVLSHGGGCPGGSYAVVGDYWAEHGYTVVQPTHPDSPDLGFDMATVDPRQMEGIIRQRVEDIHAIVDAVPVLNADPQISGRIDGSRVAAAGHSMGGATALLASGMVIENPFSKRRIDDSDARIQALVLLSEPGHNPTLPDEPWRSIDRPTFIYTGTNDLGSESGEETRIPFQYAIVDQGNAPHGPWHYLWVDGIDHYLGGLWCADRDPSTPLDTDAAAALQAASTLFLDAYVKGDESAMAQLSNNTLPQSVTDRARLSIP